MKLPSNVPKKYILYLIAPILIFFIYIGLAEAYSFTVRGYLEANLTSHIAQIKTAEKDVKTAQVSCTGTYHALMEFKQDSGIELTNSGNPCGF